MYEKLCAILDALRERGFTCKAETVGNTGIWEIILLVPIPHGVKVQRYPLTYSFMKNASADLLISYVCEEVFS